MMSLHSTWVVSVAASLAATLMVCQPALAEEQSKPSQGNPSVSQLSHPAVSVSISRQSAMRQQTLQASSYQMSVEERRGESRLWPGVSEFENRFGDRGFRYRLARF